MDFIVPDFKFAFWLNLVIYHKPHILILPATRLLCYVYDAAYTHSQFERRTHNGCQLSTSGGEKKNVLNANKGRNWINSVDFLVHLFEYIVVENEC